MAEKVIDSDSDEYEIMNPNALVNLLQNSTPAPGIEQPQELQQQPKKKDKKKKKTLFKRLSRGKADKKDTSITELPRVTESVLVKSQALQTGEAPKLGPKPPRKLSEEEMLEQIRRKQKVAVAAARQDRLRRSSESNAPERYHRSQALEYHPGYTIDRTYGELEVKDILNKYNDHLPLKVLVSKGIYGEEERYSLATSDKCVIHYIKRRELVQIHDPKTNTEFSVPMNSAIKFGIVYNPHNVETQALNGLQFQYVSDILAETKLPKMGVARLRDQDVIGMKSVEVLVIKEVIFPDNSIDPRQLRVYSLTAKCHRDLPETQEVNFRTTPSLMQLYLPDLLKHVPDLCPFHVAMYRNPLSRPLVAPGMPSSMFRRPMYLKKRYTDILLIASGCSEGEGSEGAEAFEIPTDIDVEFEVIKCSPEEKERLAEESKKLKEKLGKANIRHHRYIGMTDEQHRMQQSLYKSLREVEELEQNTELDDDYVRATSGNRLAMNHRVELLEENMKRCSYSLAEAKATIDTITKDNQVLMEKVRCLEEAASEQKQTQVTVETVQRQLDRVYVELDALREEGCGTRGMHPTRSEGVAHIPSVIGHKGATKIKAPPTSGADNMAKIQDLVVNVPEKTDPSDLTENMGVANTEATPTTGPLPAITGDIISETYDRNKILLSRMRKVEVSRMLSGAGLGQYVAKLSSEGVSGDILAECNDQMLEKELGITSKLHRLKFVRIIEGKAPVEWYQLVD